jgi:hypothetical protein
MVTARFRSAAWWWSRAERGPDKSRLCRSMSMPTFGPVYSPVQGTRATRTTFCRPSRALCCRRRRQQPPPHTKRRALTSWSHPRPLPRGQRFPKVSPCDAHDKDETAQGSRRGLRDEVFERGGRERGKRLRGEFRQAGEDRAHVLGPHAAQVRRVERERADPPAPRVGAPAFPPRVLLRKLFTKPGLGPGANACLRFFLRGRQFGNDIAPFPCVKAGLADRGDGRAMQRAVRAVRDQRLQFV